MKGRFILVLLLISSIILFLISISYFEVQLMARNDNSDLDWFKHQREDDPDRLYETRSDGVIVVGVYNAGYLYHSSHKHGISTDIIIELFSRLDLEYEIVEMPRARLSSMIAEGTLPVGVSSVKTPERAEHSYFIPYLAQRNEILVRADADVSTEEEFLNNKNLKFGIVRGYYYGEYYEELIERLKKEDMVVEAKDIEDLYIMLKENWIQATVNNSASYQFYLDYYEIDGIERYNWAQQDPLLFRNLVFSKKYFSPEDIEIFKDTLDKMRADGTLFFISQRYLSENEIERTCHF
ncbi:MAG: amino acid ABC transporter substrate-binding protein [Clostridiaceae bacterium]|jgi:polar amino acid transport system substrate-binding protein|nr:amino acid ABC transporter substrate-binding protein [Clostridiaceae bacterium]